MNPITWCIVLAVLGVIGYFLLMRETSAPQKEVAQEQFVAPPVDDHIMDHGEHPAQEESQAPEMDVQEATPYDASESQHVEA